MQQPHRCIFLSISIAILVLHSTSLCVCVHDSTTASSAVVFPFGNTSDVRAYHSFGARHYSCNCSFFLSPAPQFLLLHRHRLRRHCCFVLPSEKLLHGKAFSRFSLCSCAFFYLSIRNILSRWVGFFGFSLVPLPHRLVYPLLHTHTAAVHRKYFSFLT